MPAPSGRWLTCRAAEAPRWPLVPQLFATAAGVSGEVRRFLTRAPGSRIDADGGRFYGRLFRNREHVAATLAMMAVWDLVPLARDLPRLDVPLLLLHGAVDATVPAHVSEDVALRVPNGRAIILSGLGYLPHEEDPGAIADLLLEAAGSHGLLPTATDRKAA